MKTVYKLLQKIQLKCMCVFTTLTYSVQRWEVSVMNTSQSARLNMTILDKHNCQKDSVKMVYFLSEISISTPIDFEQVITQINKILCDGNWNNVSKDGVL